ncbi:hypothetical protein [Chitinophaga arvensicola]|uniref:hypothetical protein n=1 Tax=Chitinophaga arvensicola TaxID=29529 RepID=UPI0015A6EE64|nr:hypothetical protein [Chitinophaga arvensicola]
MSNHLIGYKQVIPRQQYLPHHITVIPPIIHRLLHNQVIKAMYLRHVGIRKKSIGTIPVDNIVPDFTELKADLPAGNHMRPVRLRRQGPLERHKRGFTASNLTGKKYPFMEVDPLSSGYCFVLQEVGQ